MLFRMGHLRLCNINFMAPFHTLHQHFIHYRVPFNKVVKHSFCQTTSIHCARFLETTQKYKKKRKKDTSANTITSLVNNVFPSPLCSHIACPDSIQPTPYGILIVFITGFLLPSTHTVRLQALWHQY